MTVSDKMIKAQREFIDDKGVIWGADEDFAQAVVNAAWHKFDKDDESTWPKEKKDYFVMFDNERSYELPWLNYARLWEDNKILRYADPQDLMFKADE